MQRLSRLSRMFMRGVGRFATPQLHIHSPDALGSYNTGISHSGFVHQLYVAFYAGYINLMYVLGGWSSGKAATRSDLGGIGSQEG